jgi:hypothetical protein
VQASELPNLFTVFQQVFWPKVRGYQPEVNSSGQ